MPRTSRVKVKYIQWDFDKNGKLVENSFYRTFNVFENDTISTILLKIESNVIKTELDRSRTSYTIEIESNDKFLVEELIS